MLANTPPDKEVSDHNQPATDGENPGPNRLILQTLDGLPVEDPRCAGCSRLLREGTEVLAHTYLKEVWHLERLYCTECYPQTEVSLTGETEQAVLEARLSTRKDSATQRHHSVLHTREGYDLIRHSVGNTVESDSRKEKSSR